MQAPLSSQEINMFDDIIDIASTPPLDDELQQYLAAEFKDVKDGLMWWYEQCAKFP